MYDPATEQPTIVRNSQLHEDLGQVEYIFSDKTGTLTQVGLTAAQGRARRRSV